MTPGLVVAAHGSHKNADSARPALDHAARIRETGCFREVRAAFWKEEPDLRSVLRTVDADEVYVVPLFVSVGYFTQQVLPRELRLTDWDREAWQTDGIDATAATASAGDTGQTVHYCGPVGTHDAMTDVIERRAETVTDDPDVGSATGLAVVGHGTERNEHSAKAIEYHTRRLRERERFTEVRALYMDEEPFVEDLPAHFESEDVVVVPLFVADGYHTQEDIPRDVGLVDPTNSDPGAYDVPATVGTHRVWYAGAVGTEPLVAAVVVERAANAGAPVADGLALLRARYGIDAQRPDGGTR